MSSLPANLQAKARSALADIQALERAVSFDNGGVTLEELSLLGMVRVQGPGSDSSFCEQVADLVMPLPAPGLTTRKGELKCLWLTPDEWLIVTPPSGENSVLTALTLALEGRVALATMITDSRLAVEITGPCAAVLLSKGCALDLHPAKFAVGNASVTRFAKSAAMVTRVQEDAYQLYVDRSQARYTWEWLLDAAGEFVR